MTSNVFTNPFGGGGGGRGGGSGGRGYALAYGHNTIGTQVDGVVSAGSTVLTLDDVSDILADMDIRYQIGNVLYTGALVSVDEAANQITLAAGTTIEIPDDTDIYASPLIGAGSRISLPSPPSGSRWTELEINLFYYMWSSSGRLQRSGTSTGGVHGLHGWSYVQTNNVNWYTYIQDDDDDTVTSVSCGLIISSSSSFNNFWTLEYFFNDNALGLARASDSSANTYTPEISAIIVRGW